MSRPGRLVVVLRIPLQGPEKLDELSLLPPRDEFLERPLHGRCLCTFTAHRHSALEEIRIDRKVGGHVRMVAQCAAQ